MPGVFRFTQTLQQEVQARTLHCVKQRCCDRPLPAQEVQTIYTQALQRRVAEHCPSVAATQH